MGVGAYQDDAYLRDGLGLLMACDAALFGRSTYEALARLYADGTHKPAWAPRLNAIQKYVFSSTLHEARWSNSTIPCSSATARSSSAPARTSGCGSPPSRRSPGS
jgi:hypothetical protein